MNLKRALGYVSPGVVLAILALSPLAAWEIPLPVNLDTAGIFAVLAGTGITITGPTTITGAIGTAPTPAITGLENVTLIGTNHANDAVTTQAKVDLAAAYDDAAGRAFATSFTGGFDLAGQTLTPGVYRDASSLSLSGTLTLDAQGNPDAAWIFQIGSTLTTGSNSKVALVGGAKASKVFWQVGSSATLGTGTDFSGNILALTSDTLTTGATIDGSVFALNGAVTLDANDITVANSTGSTTGDDGSGGSGGNGSPSVPEAGSVLLMLGAGLGALVPFRRRMIGPEKSVAA